MLPRNRYQEVVLLSHLLSERHRFRNLTYCLYSSAIFYTETFFVSLSATVKLNSGFPSRAAFSTTVFEFVLTVDKKSSAAPGFATLNRVSYKLTLPMKQFAASTQ